MTTTTVPDTLTDKNLDTACTSVVAEINGVRAGSRQPLMSITTACQQAGAGLPVRRSMV